ncbi:response regulator receiver domain-containing protein [Dinghuibacter silviterrae]|uniref:Response regulator receiver domain-containing protein n=2 Tax=Dinghuibacter silviterrae TaxID=1539049 RepID=A0A4R8DI56_9BACT|nr:response regulator receiver domain-containing protein [Dinghuibacter silviterrae]
METKKRILLADDDREDQFIIAEAFEEIGVKDILHFVENGEHVLAWLETCAAEGTLPELIVLDLNMPKMNGTQTLLRLKEDERFRHIPVIIYSTSLNNIERDECIRLGAHSYVIKGITFNECKNIAKTLYDCCTELS